MSFASVYIDESGSHDDSPILCLAGYIFLDDQAAAFAEEWQRDVLDPYGLPHFRMVDCAHGNGPFRHLTKPQRIEAATKAIGIIKKRSACGFAVTVNPREHDEIFRSLTPHWTAYMSCLNDCLSTTNRWIERSGFSGKVAYFFEAGHADRWAAHKTLSEIFENERAVRLFNYSSHAFGAKAEFPPLQAADLLAWQWYALTKRRLKGDPRVRKDLLALTRKEDMSLHFNRRRLRSIRNQLEAKEGIAMSIDMVAASQGVNPFARYPDDHFSPIESGTRSDALATWLFQKRHETI